MQYIIFNFIYICFSQFISLPLKAKPQNKTNKTPLINQSIGRALFKIYSTEIKIEDILNLTWLTIGKVVIASFIECSNNAINV